MPNKTSQHILSTAANLLGFCLIIISSLHISGVAKNNLVDEFASLIALILIVSSILSFVSIKTSATKRDDLFESLADILFILALAGIFCIILYLTIKLWGN